MTGPLELYHKRHAEGVLDRDPEQEKAARALQRLYSDLVKTPLLFASLIPPRLRGDKGGTVKGIYLHGGVGRGKSMLMDMFFDSVPEKVKKRRVHFHAFMIEMHDWLHEKRAGKAVDNLLPDYASYVASQTKLLCFDEFHVTDVADAMILSRLFTLLFEKGLAIVATSNWSPDRLYEGGLQRELFLPFIALVKERMEIVHLDSGTDYREQAIQDLETYLHPLNAETKAKAQRFFNAFSHGREAVKTTIHVKGRDIPVRAAEGAARFTFAELCEKPLGAEDYIRIAEKFHTVFIENVPKMGYDRNNETKRLMTLIDVLYDMRRQVVVTAEAAPEKIYYGSHYKFEFDRTISRLNEMRSSSYLKVSA
jgi:cell division protein ZapE